MGPDVGSLGFVAFSHRGVTLAYDYFGGIYVAPFAKVVSSTLYEHPVGVRLTRSPRDNFDVRPDLSPSWSPDGTRLAFTRYKSESSFCGTIYTARRDGHDPRRLVGGCASASAWSPDGRSIASLKGAYLMAIPPRGGHPRRITGSDAYTVDWQPLPG